MKKKLLAVGLALAMLLGLCACGGPKEPEDVLAAAAENMEALESCAVDMEMRMKVGVEGIELPIEMTLEGELITDPPTSHLEVAMDLAFISLEVDTYSEMDGGDLITYTGMDVGSGMEWKKEITEGRSTADSIMETFEAVQELSEGEEEEIDGVKTTRYDALIDGRALSELSESAMGGMEDMMDGEESGLDFSQLEDIPYSLWIDRKELRIVKVEMDLGEALQSVMSEELGSVSEFLITIYFSEFNEIDEIEIPDEARDA